jgi:hypothetical protein
MENSNINPLCALVVIWLPTSAQDLLVNFQVDHRNMLAKQTWSSNQFLELMAGV